MMNPIALRLLQLLQEKPQGVNPAIMDDGMDNLPEPRFQGLTPEEMKVQTPVHPRGLIPPVPSEVIPQKAPLAVEESDEDRIRRLFTEETPGMKAYRDHVSNAPDYDKLKPSKGRTILAALLGAGSSLLGEDTKTSMGLGMGVAHARYNNAVKDYNTKGKGLEDIASLDEKRKGREVTAETAIEGMKTRKAISDQVVQQRISDENRKHSEEMERAKDRDERQAEVKRHNEAMEKLYGSREQDRADAAKDRADARVGSFYDQEKNENVTTTAGEARARGLGAKVGDKVVDREKFIRNAKGELEGALSYFEKNPGKSGQFQGNWSKLKRWAGTNDADLLKNMNILESYRGESLRDKAGTALTKTELKVFDPVLGGITQSDQQLVANLKESIRRLGTMSRGKSGSKVMTLSDGTEIEVEE